MHPLPQVSAPGVIFKPRDSSFKQTAAVAAFFERFGAAILLSIMS